jgi:hypothetical protein
MVPRRSERYIVPKRLQPYTRPLYRLARQTKIGLQTLICRVNPRPVLILGNQKSGTTAIAALLGQLTRRSVTLDLAREVHDPTYDRLHRKELTFEDFIGRNKLDFSRQIVKEPFLTLFQAELRRRFPDSPMVFVVRDPRDNLRSILNRLELPGDLATLPERDLSRISRVWRLVLDNRWLGIAGENYIEQLAGRWRWTAESYLADQDKMILIRYEDFLLDKASAIGRLAAAVGLTAVADISEMVDVQFQPRGNREVSWGRFFGADNLARIERICFAAMHSLRYEPTTGIEARSP